MFAGDTVAAASPFLAIASFPALGNFGDYPAIDK